MKYKVVFHSQASEDIRTSYDWGVRYWGKTQADTWLRNIYVYCKNRLKTFPESCPEAPESEEFDITIRQLVIDRYRLLFVVRENAVEILHVRGPYHLSTDGETDDDL